MKFKQVFGSILLLGFISFLVLKFKEHIPRSGDDWIWLLLLAVIVGFLVMIIRKILYQ